MEELKVEMMDKRNIGSKTADLYLRNLRILKKKVDGEGFDGNLNWLNSYEKVSEVLSKEKTNTRKTRLASIVVALKLKDMDKLAEKYSDDMYSAINEYKTFIETNEKTDYQKENWASLDDLKDVWNILKREVYADNLHKASKKIADKGEKDVLQKWLVASLYILTKPRRNRDYSNMDIITEPNYNELSDGERDTNNYLVIKNNRDMFFSMGDYKTNNYAENGKMKNRGIQKITIPKKLKQVIKVWRKYNMGQVPLIVNNRGSRMSANSLTKYLMKIFSKTGKKKISSTMLRHIFITENPKLKEFREKKKQAETTADEMGHSIQEQQNYNKVNE
jgi:integrase